MSIDEIAYLLGHSEACLGISIPEKKKTLEAAIKKTGMIQPVICVDAMETLPLASTAAADSIPNEQTECALLYYLG